MTFLKKLNNTIVLALLPAIGGCDAPIKHAKTATVSINGNCGMCEKRIESAGNRDGLAKVAWDKETRQATITYDATKTSVREILKRISLSGYDSDTFTAPDEAYDNLHECCQYERAGKPGAK